MSDPATVVLPREIALSELAQGESDLLQEIEIEEIIQYEDCVRTALEDPLLDRAGAIDICLRRINIEAGTTTTTEKSEDPPNPVLPAVNEIFWSAVFFLILWMLMKYVLLKPIQRLRAERAMRMQDDRDAAERASQEYANAQSEYDAALMATREEANVLLDNARTRASERRAELVGAAVAEVSAAREVATNEMAEARARAVESLRGEIRGLAVDAATNVLGSRPQDTSAADRIIDDFISEVEAGIGTGQGPGPGPGSGTVSTGPGPGSGTVSTGPGPGSGTISRDS